MTSENDNEIVDKTDIAFFSLNISWHIGTRKARNGERIQGKSLTKTLKWADVMKNRGAWN